MARFKLVRVFWFGVVATFLMKHTCHAENRFQKFLMMFGMGMRNKQMRPIGSEAGSETTRQGYGDEMYSSDQTCINPATHVATTTKLLKVQSELDEVLQEKSSTAEQLYQLQVELERYKKESKTTMEKLSNDLDASNTEKEKALKNLDAVTMDLNNAKAEISEMQQDLKSGDDEASKLLGKQLDHANEKLSKLEEEKVLLTEELSRLNGRYKKLEKEMKSVHPTKTQDEIDGDIEQEVFKRLSAQVKAIKDQMNENWQMKLSETETAHKNEIETMNSKMEMIKIGSRHLVHEKEEQAKEACAKDTELLTKAHQDEKAKLIQLANKAEKEKNACQSNMKNAVASTILLEEKMIHARSNITYWKNAFKKRSHLNITQYVESLEGLFCVLATPYLGVDLRGAYKRSKAKPHVDRGWAVLSDFWENATSIVGKHLKDDLCPKALSTLKSKEGIEPLVISDTEKVCNEPRQVVDVVMVITCGLCLILFKYLLSCLFSMQLSSSARKGMKVVIKKEEKEKAIEPSKGGNIEASKKPTKIKIKYDE